MQELYNEAEKYYEDSVRKIKAVYLVYRKKTGRTQGDALILKQFDEILQAVLLTEALIDGRFRRREVMFIDLLAKHGDLLKAISEATGGELQMTWTDIASLDEETQMKLAGILPGILDKTSRNFVSIMAQVDKDTESIDVLKDITTNIGHICACLSAFDGESVKKESKAAGAMISTLLYQRWKAVLDS